MTNKFTRLLFLFLAIVGAVTLLGPIFHVEFGREDFWKHHRLLFLIFIAFFPRLTLLFSSVATGGLLWWLGFIFAPRVLVAVLATVNYWHMNPILVLISWSVALSGESTEKVVIARRKQWGTWAKPKASRGPTVKEGSATVETKNGTVEVEYRITE